MKNITCYVVDDQKEYIYLLEQYILQTPGLALIGGETNPLQALQRIRSRDVTPDLTFVDMDMPGITGLELAAQVKDQTLIIFSTGFPSFAAQSYDFDAIDYLVKPYSYERFLKAIGRAYKSISPEGGEQDYIYIKTDKKGKLLRIDFNDITLIESELNYIRIYANSKSYITYLTLKEIEEALPAVNFIKVHRSFIINLDKVRYLEGNNIIMDDDKSVVASDSYKDKFMQAINPYLLESKRKR